MLESLGGLITSSALLYMMAGTLLGLIFGAIPGLTATLAVVILIPLTYSLDTVSGVAMLIGAYMGGISGGFVAAIMLNMPGTPSSITTTFDGFPLAQQGKAGKALGVGNTSNLVGSFIGWVFLLCLAPLLSKVALSFSAFEYTVALIFGFTAVIALSGESPMKGLIAALLGLTLTLVGYDTLTGMPRATFGIGIYTGRGDCQNLYCAEAGDSPHTYDAAGIQGIYSEFYSVRFDRDFYWNSSRNWRSLCQLCHL